MDKYKIEYLLNELKNNNINTIHLCTLTNQIIIPYKDNYIIIEVQDSKQGYNKEIENNTIAEDCDDFRDINTIRLAKRIKYSNTLKNTLIVNVIKNIYVIKINFNAYMTKNKKRYKNIFIEKNNIIYVNKPEWEWRFNLIKLVLLNIEKKIDISEVEENKLNIFNNYYIKLFYRHFSNNDIDNFNVLYI